MRGVEQRIAWILAHRPGGTGRCAEHVMHALDAARQGLPDATAVLRAVQRAGHPLHTGPAPRGAIGYWSGGSAGHGHVAIALGDLGQSFAGVDVHGPGTVGARPLAWYRTHWPALRFEGWSWWWGSINTEPQEAAMTVPRKTLTLAAWPVGKQLLIERKGKSTVSLPGGRLTTVAVVDVPKGGRFRATLQVRMPKGMPAGEAVLARRGWGDPGPDGRDETGGNPIPAASTFRRWRTPIEGHSVAGGGPLEARVWLPKAGVIEFVYKVERTS